ncbi:uncharacterized protein LOC133852538 [Alnus glutinosa]|uniref:uncharacterized protein LOC133852538 n=1 Tax=Alnus glutinosa TaxID=3517 RepID=UPI002D77CAE1|nr:uncharacterized protein LOC133852538 [Alnus glutinosa]
MKQIKDKEGRMCSSKEEIEEAFVDYFSNLFKAEESLEVEACVEVLERKVTVAMNQKLLAEFTIEEITVALNQMSPLKAPGRDGFPACFYQHNWATVHPEVLANRLKLVLPDIISCYQSAFIPGRLIIDNVITAYETMHSMQTRMWSKVGFMGIKLDMSIEQVVVNGNLVGNIQPTRGIRKGDPISPYLFLLCVEVLSTLLHKEEQRGVITGVPTSPKGPHLSHLFFADDSLLFCKANSVEWRQLMKILGVYEARLGQKLNLNKTSIFFSRNTSNERKQEILLQSGLSEATRIDSYLGLPIVVGKSKRLAFNDIVERVSKRLSNWKVKFLS